VAFIKLHQQAVNAARAVGAEREKVNEYAEKMVRGVRRTGELIAELPRSNGGRPKGKKTSDTDVTSFCKEAAISYRSAARWQGVAEIPQQKFNSIIESILDDDDPAAIITLAPFYALLKRSRGRSTWREARDSDIESAIVLGDFREMCADLPDSSVDLIFTDPPYDRESLPLYDALAAQAKRVLRPGGSLLTYCGHYLLPEVIQRCTQAGMRYWWLNAHRHAPGFTLARMKEYGTIVQWKPIAWFVKETRGDKHTLLHDLVEADREKDTHPWQQAVGVASYYIDNLTAPGALVVDFMCGGGTTLLAADRLGRKWRGYEINEKARCDAIERIASDRAARV